MLDLMSSWISHLPAGYQPARAVGLGMNADELSRNPALDDWVVHDLNREPTLPFDDASFDAVLIAVSVQYLQRPLEVFAEIARVLEPGGLCVVSFSNRCFPTKAVALWQGLNDSGHVQAVGAYFQHAGGFEATEWFERKTPGADPLYIVQARTRCLNKRSANQARSKSRLSIFKSRTMPAIVPGRKSLLPQFGIVVRVPSAGFRQISCDPRAWRSNSQPSDLSLRVSSRYVKPRRRVRQPPRSQVAAGRRAPGRRR